MFNPKQLIRFKIHLGVIRAKDAYITGKMYSKKHLYIRLTLEKLGLSFHLALTYLQQSSELAVSVVDILVAVLVTQGIDAVAQGKQGAVDVSPFFQPLTPVLSLRQGERRGREGRGNVKYDLIKLKLPYISSVPVLL